MAAGIGSISSTLCKYIDNTGLSAAHFANISTTHGTNCPVDVARNNTAVTGTVNQENIGQDASWHRRDSKPCSKIYRGFSNTRIVARLQPLQLAFVVPMLSVTQPVYHHLPRYWIGDTVAEGRAARGARGAVSSNAFPTVAPTLSAPETIPRWWLEASLVISIDGRKHNEAE